MINRHYRLGATLLAVVGAGAMTSAEATNSYGDTDSVVVTASNTTTNDLLIYSTNGSLLKQLPTQGQGGVTGNAGGIAQSRDWLAVVNFASNNVSVFAKGYEPQDLRLHSVVSTVAGPVSVAFGDDHLYILSTTHVESHLIDRNGVRAAADGVARLLHADGTAAQVGHLNGQLIISEKSNAIETVNLDSHGAVSGAATLVANIPQNVNAPFGLVTRGNDAYVTIAHANEVSLVRNDSVLEVTASGTQHAPCWVTLEGPFLFSANSPSQSVSRYAVYGQVIVQDEAVVATFNGNPTDIAYHAGKAAVVDSNGSVSHLSVFRVDEDGNFTLSGVATINSITTNGVAVIAREDRWGY